MTWTNAPRLDERKPRSGAALALDRRHPDPVGMRPNGENRWSGQAYNTEDGQTYSGNMSVSGTTLTTQGCVLGGLICRSVNWRRI